MRPPQGRLNEPTDAGNVPKDDRRRVACLPSPCRGKSASPKRKIPDTPLLRSGSKSKRRGRKQIIRLGGEPSSTLLRQEIATEVVLNEKGQPRVLLTER
jgi:hypothetical protein